jgi:hypothetical protein
MSTFAGVGGVPVAEVKERKSLEARAEAMADFALKLLSKLPPQQRRARIRAMAEAAASSSASPLSRGSDASAGETPQSQAFPRASRRR